MRPAVAFLALTMAVLGARVAAAQDGAQDAAAARQLFDRGREAAAAHDYSAACRYFEDSLKARSTSGTLLNLADCNEHLEHVATAWRYYRRAIDSLPRGDPRIAYATRRATSLEPRLPRLTIAISETAPPDASVTLDGVSVDRATLGAAQPTDPGPHHVEVRASAHQPRTYDFEMAEGQTKTLAADAGEAEVAPLAPPPATPPESKVARETTTGSTPAGASGAPAASDRVAPAPSGHGRRTAGLVVGGIGVAGVAVGVVAGVLTMNRWSYVSQNCDVSAHSCNDASGLDAASKGRTFSVVSTVGFAGGLVAVGVGAFLVLSSGGGPAPTTAIAPAVSPTSAGVTLVRAF
jgi:hypothetical protein